MIYCLVTNSLFLKFCLHFLTYYNDALKIIIFVKLEENEAKKKWSKQQKIKMLSLRMLTV